MSALGVTGNDSAKIGSSLAELLTTPGLKQADLETQLGGLIGRQQQDVDSAAALDVPGPIRPATDHAVEALQLRVAGMQGLLDTFSATKDDDSKNATEAGEKLAEQARKLDASDVVWQDPLPRPCAGDDAGRGRRRHHGPASVFVETAELYTARSMTAIWLRIHGASTGGTPSGVHGTGLEKVRRAAGGTQLVARHRDDDQGLDRPRVRRLVKNTGENQEVGIEVTLTIPKGTTPIVKKQTIDILDIGETKTVTFKDFPDPPFGEKTSVQVSVKPVQGETNTANNSAEYPVIFSLE